MATATGKQGRRELRHFSTTTRWLSILARTAHIGLGAVLFGGIILATPQLQLMPWHHLAIASGILLLLFELQHDPNWYHCGKAILVYFHFLLALSVHIAPSQAVPLLWAALIIGCIGSHMPRRYRHWSIRFGFEQKK